MHETRVWFLCREDPLEKRMATHSSILVWRIPWAEEPGRLQSVGLQRVRHDLATKERKRECLDGMVCVCVCLGLLRDFVSSVWNHEWHQIWIQMTQFSYWLCFTLRVAPSSPPGKWAEFGRITVPLILKFHLCKMGTTPKSVLSELLWASVR